MLPITQLNGEIGFVRLSMRLDEFPTLLRRGLEADPSTPFVEAEAKRLVASKFPIEACLAFVRSVCRWGNYAGVGGRVIQNNTPGDIKKALERAHAASQEDRIGEALSNIEALKCLGVSFASKHLKFLDPERNVVLDSIISSRLGYPMTIRGYCDFVSDCKAIQTLLVENNIDGVADTPGSWRLADVEMAIFQKLRN